MLTSKYAYVKLLDLQTYIGISIQAIPAILSIPMKFNHFIEFWVLGLG